MYETGDATAPRAGAFAESSAAGIVAPEKGNASGVIFAPGSRFGGHSLFLNNGRLYYVYNFLGIKPEQVFKSAQRLKPGKCTLGMELRRDRAGDKGESIGVTQLYIDERSSTRAR